MAKKKTGPSREKKRNVTAASGMKPATITTLIIVAVAAAALIYLFYPDSKPKDPERDYELSIARSLGLEFKNQGSLSFLTGEGDTAVTIAVEVADDNVKRRIGMMFREKAEEKQGMLFIFPFSEIRSFWMRNTVLSLDMIFIDEQKRIVNIEKSTVPFTERSYFSTGPARYVLEVRAGFADKYNLSAGQEVTWILNKQ